MSDKLYEELGLERTIKEKFGVDVVVRNLIVSKIPVSRTATATLILTVKRQLYLYIHGQSNFVLGDIKKLVAHIGLKAEQYIPPKGRPLYFDEIGRAKFHDVFPGRTHVTSDDIMFYKTLAPYNPALVLISEVKNGEVYQYDNDAAGDWRVVVKFTYRRIKTS